MDTEIFDVFTKTVTAEDLKEAADRLVYSTGHPLNVFTGEGGPIAHIIKERLIKGTRYPTNIKALTEKLVTHYKLGNYSPRTSLMREAMALTVQLKKVIEKVHPDFYGVLNELVDRTDEFETPEDVYLIPYEKAGEIASGILDVV